MLSSLRRVAQSVRPVAVRWSSSFVVPESLSPGERVIYEKLYTALAPSQLVVEDISGGCGSMYRVDIESAAFAGLPLVKQHRIVNDTLAEDVKKMHGIRITTRAPKKQ